MVLYQSLFSAPWCAAVVYFSPAPAQYSSWHHTRDTNLCTVQVGETEANNPHRARSAEKNSLRERLTCLRHVTSAQLILTSARDWWSCDFFTAHAGRHDRLIACPQPISESSSSCLPTAQPAASQLTAVLPPCFLQLTATVLLIAGTVVTVLSGWSCPRRGTRLRSAAAGGRTISRRRSGDVSYCWGVSRGRAWACMRTYACSSGSALCASLGGGGE